LGIEKYPAMPLTPEEMKKLIVQLENLCVEAKELQTRVQQAMAARARGDRQDQGRQPERPTKTRKANR
jgi:hypothetical protein